MKITAFARTEQGTGASRRLRNAGMTPGIVYGGSKEPANIKLDHNALFHALKRESFHSTIHEIEIDGATEQVMLRDFQMHAYKPLVMHIDFQRIDPAQKITTRVPLHFVNADVSPAVKQGGSSVHYAASAIDISCLPKDLPEFITVDLSEIKSSQMVYLGDVVLPEGVTAVANDKKQAIASATKAK
ncbi:MAG: ribosomal subunit protein [Burkholderiaceae bacterium]|nr:ribosomal subunit protein [Burkholderiaceae bacterium]